MNLKGSHLLWLVLIVYCNYLLFKAFIPKDLNVYIVLMIMQYIIIFVTNILHLKYNEKSVDIIYYFTYRIFNFIFNSSRFG